MPYRLPAGRRRPASVRPAVFAAVGLALLLAGCGGKPAPEAENARGTGAGAEVEAGAAATTAIARISPAAAKTVGIELAEAGPATIGERLPLYGVVKPNAEHVREVIARFPGTVKTVRRAIGDRVRAGETLATIESNESLQTYALTAPIAGIVTAREADPGEQAGSELLFTIADPASVWIELSLFPADAARVRSGQAVRIDSVGGELHAEGRIGLVGVFGSGADAAPIARVVLANPDGRWTPGLYVNGAVELSTTTVPVAVAATALQTVDGRPVVFVPVAGGYAPRAVRTGRADDRAVEIVEGLAAGEAYVARSSFVVKADLGKSALEEEDDDKPATATEPSEAPAAPPAPPTKQGAPRKAGRDGEADDKAGGDAGGDASDDDARAAAQRAGGATR